MDHDDQPCIAQGYVLEDIEIVVYIINVRQFHADNDFRVEGETSARTVASFWSNWGFNYNYEIFGTYFVLADRYVIFHFYFGTHANRRMVFIFRLSHLIIHGAFRVKTNKLSPSGCALSQR